MVPGDNNGAGFYIIVLEIEEDQETVRLTETHAKQVGFKNILPTRQICQDVDVCTTCISRSQIYPILVIFISSHAADITAVLYSALHTSSSLFQMERILCALNPSYKQARDDGRIAPLCIIQVRLVLKLFI